ncbi:MAG: SEC-C domain-containing protein, partial [Firmicutes bacterium]|nr:SEC-C domain-containing protein [Bacillota bacterium]
NLPVKREDLPDSVYTSEDGKFRAIVERIKEIHATGQPILVGTISIEKSERLGSMLDRSGLKGQYNILNAKQHEKEAQIVAEAGRLGKVTIATNMAGRGTDIILGGNPEFEARRELEKREYTQEQIAFAVSLKKPANADEQKLRDEYKAILAEKRAVWEEEHKQVVSLGGLAIIGSERHESRRIDNQLRGRSGRQGDPGCTQFFVSLEDDLMRLFGGERMQSLMGRVGMEEDQALEAGMLSKAIEGAQKKVEGRNFGIRKYVLQYDNVMNRQREIIYGERRKVLFGEDLKDQIMGMKDTLIESMVEAATADSKYPEEWDLATLSRNLRRISPDYRGRKRTEEEIAGLTKESLIEEICGDFSEIYEKKEKELGSDFLRVMERSILLLNVDRQWMDHIDAMDQLKSGIGLRSIGQMNPAAEYAKEGFDMFDQLIGTIQEDTVKNCYGITGETKLIIKKANLGGMQAKKDEFEDKELKAAAASSRKGGSGRGGAPRGGMPGGMPNAPEVPPREKKQETVRRETPKVGRNDPCPCGSGKKYKNCCMKKDMGLVSDPFDGDK